LVTVAQVQTTTVVQKPNGTYSIVEYPMGKETTVTLNPVTAALGTAVVRRDATGSTININLTNVPHDWTSLYAYAVEPNGAVTNLGPINPVNGSATFTARTPLSRFMLVVSPEPSLTAYDVNTRVYLRSAVPSGLTVLPFSGSASAVGERVSTIVNPEYRVPMLGIPSYKLGDETKLKINFSGAMEGSRANVFIKPHSHARATEVQMHFHDLKEAPKNTVYTLWAVSPSDEYQKLGSIMNVRGKNEAEIKSETTFDDFGLMITAEDAGTTRTIVRPSGRRVGVIEIIR
jgi:hypothetical protein